jgi:hypothetical protein
MALFGFQISCHISARPALTTYAEGNRPATFQPIYVFHASSEQRNLAVKRFIQWTPKRLLSRTSRPRKTAYKPPLAIESLEERLAFDSTLGTAINFGSLAGQVSTSGHVGTFDKNDFYRFSLPLPGTVNVRLSGMSNNANLQLIQDVNGNGLIDLGDSLVRSSNSGTASEEINKFLAAGTYFVGVNYAGVFSFGGTSYTMRLSSDLAGNTLSAARDLGAIAGRMPPVRDFVGANPADGEDLYRVTMVAPGLLHMRLSGLSGDANLQLIADINNNGRIDPGEALDTSARSGTTSEEILTRIQGTFFVRVIRASGDTNYQLDMLSDFAGDRLELARDFGDLSGQKSATDHISFGDLSGDNDFYRFELAAPGTVKVELMPQQITSLITGIDLVRDFNNNGFVDTGEIVLPAVFSGSHNYLPAGVYFLRYQVFGKFPNSLNPAETNYTLRLTSDLAGNDIPSNREVGSLGGRVSFTELLAGADTSDFYGFDLAAPGAVNIALKNSNADLRLIQDINNNRTVDDGETLATSSHAGTSSEQILVFLGAGSYFVQVVQPTGGPGLSTNGGYTLELTADLAGNTLGAARELGVLANDMALLDFLSKQDTSDFYHFDLSKTAKVTVEATSGDDDFILELIQDANNNGIVDPGEVVASSVAESFDKTVSANLKSGEYYVRVFSNDDAENYQLRLISDLDDKLATARNIGSLQGRVSFNDLVGGTDLSDFYQFDLAAPGTANVALKGLASGADLRLIQDVNNNGVVDEGEILASSSNDVTSDELIDVVLEAGTYFIEVVGSSESLFTSGGGGYTLELTADLAGNALRTARELGTLTNDLALVDFLSEEDTDDFYRFSISQSANVIVEATSRDDDLIVELIRDNNSNGIVDLGEVIATGTGKDFDKTISASLASGTYFVRVASDDFGRNYSMRLSL